MDPGHSLSIEKLQMKKADDNNPTVSSGQTAARRLTIREKIDNFGPPPSSQHNNKGPSTRKKKETTASSFGTPIQSVENRVVSGKRNSRFQSSRPGAHVVHYLPSNAGGAIGSSNAVREGRHRLSVGADGTEDVETGRESLPEAFEVNGDDVFVLDTAVVEIAPPGVERVVDPADREERPEGKNETIIRRIFKRKFIIVAVIVLIMIIVISVSVSISRRSPSPSTNAEASATSPTQASPNMNSTTAPTPGRTEAHPSTSPTIAPTPDKVNDRFCGTTFVVASQECSTPCPSGLNVDCPEEETCYGNVETCDHSQEKDPHKWCGQSWEEAATSCTTPCPFGTNAECQNGETCYADVTQCTAPTSAPSRGTGY